MDSHRRRRNDRAALEQVEDAVAEELFDRRQERKPERFRVSIGRLLERALNVADEERRVVEPGLRRPDRSLLLEVKVRDILQPGFKHTVEVAGSGLPGIAAALYIPTKKAWSSSAPEVADVNDTSAKGLVTAVSLGVATISATVTATVVIPDGTPTQVEVFGTASIEVQS